MTGHIPVSPRVALCAWLIVFGFAAGAAAQPTMPFDHVHIPVSDPAKSTAWYALHLAGAPGPANDRVFYGNVIVAFQKVGGDRPPAAGGAIDHIAITVVNLADKLPELESAGAKIVDPVRDVPGGFRAAVVEDPWGAKIELIQDSGRPRLHHVHLRAADPAATLAWYQKMFGGELGKLHDGPEGVRFGEVWLLADRTPDGTELPGTGRVIDHLGWRPEDVDAKVVELKAKGATILSEPRAFRDLHFAFVEAPAGVRIELTQRPPSATTAR